MAGINPFSAPFFGCHESSSVIRQGFLLLATHKNSIVNEGVCLIERSASSLVITGPYASGYHEAGCLTRVSSSSSIASSPKVVIRYPKHYHELDRIVTAFDSAIISLPSCRSARTSSSNMHDMFIIHNVLRLPWLPLGIGLQ